MLRHFAVLTIVITACIAIFAQGENNAAKVKNPQAVNEESSGNALSAMIGGAEAAALKQSREGKPTREVNGMRIASGTNLSNNYYEETTTFAQPEVTGDIRNFDPAHAIVLDEKGTLPEPANQPPPMIKDANGIPAPSVAAGINQRPNPGKAQPPRQATRQDYERMMAESQQRSGTAGTED